MTQSIEESPRGVATAMRACQCASGTEIPVLPLVCPNCGYVTLFSAKFIGLADRNRIADEA